MAVHYFGRSDAHSLLDKILVRATTDMPLHERFARLSQIHSQRSNRKSHSSSRHAIEPDEVRIQIRPFDSTSDPSRKRPASSMRSDLMMAKSSKMSRLSGLAARPNIRAGTMVMDRKPKSLSERISGASREMQSRPSIPSLMANLNAIAKRGDKRESASLPMSKKKAVQRLGMQARLGAKTQTQSAKERLTLNALPAAKRANLISNFPKRFQKVANGNHQMNKKPTGPYRKPAPVASQKQSKPSKSANDLDKELEEFMSHK